MKIGDFGLATSRPFLNATEEPNQEYITKKLTKQCGTALDIAPELENRNGIQMRGAVKILATILIISLLRDNNYRSRL